MLFQRLYNWIKYKTLPSSFLFKNRLFIERDSKHRRVLSNFGLSFRNSKWSNYETYNIKLQFKKLYLKYIFFLFLFFFFFFFFLYFKQYYMSSSVFNNISFLFWISIDAFDYYLSFVVWLVTISLSLFFNTIYSYFFYNNFSRSNYNKKIFSNSAFLKSPVTSNFNSKDLYVSKHDLNWLLYSWLTNPTSGKNINILDNVFESSINKEWWDKYYDFFIKLYKVSFFLNLSSEKYTYFSLNNTVSKLSNKYYKGDYMDIIYYCNNTTILNNYSSFVLYYILNNYKNYFDVKNNKSVSLKLLNTKNDWNLYNFNNELDKYPLLIKNKTGLFVLDYFNYQKFSYFIFNFEELWSLNIYLKNQLNSAKWNRWLYRYSILHRKILKNSHKITLSKKLINSGFYDSKLFNKNVWASEHFSKLSSNYNFTSFFSTYYNSLFEKNNNKVLNSKLHLINNGNQKDSLALLNFYENSYFWYLKRFYLFNTLPNNFIKSKLNKNTQYNDLLKSLNDSKDGTFIKYSVFLSYLLNSSYTNLNLYSHFNNNNISLNDIYKNFNSNTSYIKDIYLLNNENDLLNRDNLNVLYWIISTSDKKNNLVFFNYLNLNKPINNNYYSLFLLNNKDMSGINYWLTYSLINFDAFYLNDILYFSIFN